MKNIIKTIRTTFLILLIPFLYSACNFIAAGSYPLAEYYEFNTTTDELIEKANIFKKKNPTYKVFTYIEDGNIEEVLGRQHEYDYTLHFYFEDIDKKIHCVIKGNRIGLTGIEEGVTIFGDWKTINTKDLSEKENEEIKKKFETEILDKLGEWERVKTRW